DICWQPDGYVTESGDCDDFDASVSPDAVEICDADGTDEDCDGLVNEADPSALGTTPAYIDAAGDGFCTGAADYCECYDTSGLATVGGDCDDSSAARNPSAAEGCDAANVDEDCDGLADDLDPEGPVGAVAWFPDVDGDGHGDPDGGPNWFCD